MYERGIKTWLAVLSIAAVIVGALVPMTWYLSQPSQPSEEGLLFGNSAAQMEEWYGTLVYACQAYVDNIGDRILLQNAQWKFEKQLVDLRYMATSLDVDGIIMVPLGESADIIEWLVYEKGIPVATYDTDAETPAITVNVSVNNVEMGKTLAQKLMDVIEEKEGEVKGTIFILTCYESPVGTPRIEGMREALDEYPDVEVIDFDIPQWAMDTAKTTTVEAISAYGKPLAILGCNGLSTLGAVGGLEYRGMAVPQGEEGHVYVGSFDVYSDTINYLKEGIIDVGADQPNLFYGTLGIYFIKRVIEEKPVPTVGTTLISDDTKPDGPQPDGTWNIVLNGEYLGVEPFAIPFWAPVTIVEANGHMWLPVAPAIVYPDTVANAPIWANCVADWITH